MNDRAKRFHLVRKAWPRVGWMNEGSRSSRSSDVVLTS